MLVYKLGIEELPKSCIDCKCHWCSLPLKHNSRGGITDSVKKKYLTQRYEKCPIIEVKEEL